MQNLVYFLNHVSQIMLLFSTFATFRNAGYCTFCALDWFPWAGTEKMLLRPRFFQPNAGFDCLLVDCGKIRSGGFPAYTLHREKGARQLVLAGSFGRFRLCPDSNFCKSISSKRRLIKEESKFEFIASSLFYTGSDSIYSGGIPILWTRTWLQNCG